ncbi:hypothetical protein G6011_02079 [Alternaria panax]|uniref:Ankyrin repeat protein n=1 Tax=Alternaria panax TaxID=48097 RepID=A0AAD4I8R1_9PLEO|nr:hypothetical protein G6011_02079 [Alternaria panax]
MASFTHRRILNYTITFKDKYHRQEATRTHTNITVDDELMEATSSAFFNVIRPCTAISYGCSVKSIEKYIQHYRNDETEFKEMVHQAMPILCYAIGRNSVEMVTLLLKIGFGPEGCTDDAHFILVLAFAVSHGHLHLQDTTEVSKVLLAAEANLKTIHEDTWQQYLKQPEEKWPIPKS